MGHEVSIFEGLTWDNISFLGVPLKVNRCPNVTDGLELRSTICSHDGESMTWHGDN